MPWAGPLLLSWAGLLGWRELMAGCSAEEGERSSCPGAAALQSPAGLRALPAGTERRGERLKTVSCWKMQRDHLRRNLHSPSHS